VEVICLKELFEIIQEIEKDESDIINNAKEIADELIRITEDYVAKFKKKEINEAKERAKRLGDELVEYIKKKEKELIDKIKIQRLHFDIPEDKVNQIINKLVEEILNI